MSTRKPGAWRKGRQRSPVIDWEDFDQRRGKFDPSRCAAVTLSNDLHHRGRQCGMTPARGERYCWVHGGKRVSEVAAETQANEPDPREILKAAGLRVPEVNALYFDYYGNPLDHMSADGLENYGGEAAILALVRRLVTAEKRAKKYKANLARARRADA